MLLRTVLMFALMLGSHTGLAAEPAPDTDTDAAATSDTDATASADPDASEDGEDAEPAEAADSLDGEGFVPSVQISEDLSVSFPTDI